MIKDALRRLNFNHGVVFASKVGDFVENSIGNRIQNKGYEAPVLSGAPEEMVWYKVPLPEGRSGDGSEYYTYISKGKRKDLCIILSGGGVAWNEYTAARPVTGGKVASWQPNFYWNNLRPFTQIMNINIGITDTKNEANPFSDWNFLVVTYATGDFHVGNSEFPYTSEEGEEEVLYFNGHNNFREAMKVAKRLFPDPERLLIAGNSAGAFAVPALAGEIAEDYYPDCRDITLFSDSALLLYDRWKKTAKDIWRADKSIWEGIKSDNITVDWYEKLYESYGSRFKYLYASSTRDYLLSAYYNDIVNKEYMTDKDVQQAFFEQLKVMTGQLLDITKDFHFYIFDWPMVPAVIGKGGTAHTALKELSFAVKKSEDRTMADWLFDQVSGRPSDIGLSLLE